jgi:hypothetical protein
MSSIIDVSNTLTAPGDVYWVGESRATTSPDPANFDSGGSV